MPAPRPPLPPFTERRPRGRRSRLPRTRGTRATPIASCSPTRSIRWRNRSEFLTGRDEIHAFLVRKWQRELDYALRKDLWAFSGDRIAVRFQYEWHDGERPVVALLRERELGVRRARPDAAAEASINDVAIAAAERRIHGPRAPGDEEAIPLR